LRHWRRPGGAFAATLLAAAALTAVLGATAAAQDTSGQSAAAIEPSFEALLARGISHSAGSEMKAGLEELRSAVRLEPGNELAHRSLAIALLRTGRFGEAEDEFALAIGRQRAAELASGLLTAADLTDSLDPDTLLGLATAIQFQGKARAREAERLHRTYAGLMGPMSKEAGKAYFRLHELAEESGVEWLDADAELVKALAVDPNIRSAMLLPEFTNPSSLPNLEPYLRPVELSSTRADTAVRYDALPVLARWVAPADTSGSLLALAEGHLRLEILVDENGRPVEVVPMAPVDDGELAALVSTVDQWRFEPATAGGANAPVWILFGAEADEEEGDTAGAGADEAEAQTAGAEAGRAEGRTAGDGGKAGENPDNQDK
jgi:tetratricopeptide (TPR) repeat protein